MAKYTAIVLSAGKGSRMGSSVHKQYLLLCGRPVIYYTLKAFEESPVDEIVLVTGEGEEEYCRKEIVEKYNEAFLRIPEITVQEEIPESDTTRHLYILRIKPEMLTIDRKQFFAAMAAENICCNVHYIPVYRHPYYEELGYEKGLCPKAEKLYEEIMSLPLYYSLTDEDVDDVIHAVTKIVENYRK